MIWNSNTVIAEPVRGSPKREDVGGREESGADIDFHADEPWLAAGGRIPVRVNLPGFSTLTKQIIHALVTCMTSIRCQVGYRSGLCEF